jgi:hypothetical protein
MVKTLSPAVKNGQNFASGGKNGLIILKYVAEGALPEKMHQGSGLLSRSWPGLRVRTFFPDGGPYISLEAKHFAFFTVGNKIFCIFLNRRRRKLYFIVGRSFWQAGGPEP